MIFKYLLSIFSILIFAQVAIAQHFNYKNYITEHGLPSSEVYSVIQDSKGYIWGATDAGLFKYNNSIFKTFTTNDGTPDNTIFNLFEDKKGRVWMTGFNGKIGYYINDKFYIPTCAKKLSEHLQFGKKVIYSMYVDSTGVVWLGSAKSLIKLLPKNNYDTFIEVKEYNDSVNTLILEPEKGHIISSKVFSNKNNRNYLTEFKNQYSFDVQIKTINTDKIFEIVKPKKLNHQPVHRQLMLSDGRIAISYINDLYFISKNGEIEKKEFDKTIISIYEDKSKNVWIGFSKGGVKCYALSNFNQALFEDLQNLSISGICVDYESSIWLSSLENGLFYSSGNSVKTEMQIPALQANIIETVNLNDTVWVVNNKRDVFAIAKNKAITFVKNFESPTVSDLFNIYQNNRIKYVAGVISGRSNSNFEISKPLKLRSLDFSASALAFYPNSLNYLGLSTTHLVEVINDEIANQFDLPSRGKCIYITHSNAVYIGTLNGLCEFKNNKFVELRLIDERYGERIMDIKPLKSDVIAIGTRGKGVLIKFGNQLSQITTANGLVSDICNSITTGSKNDLWIATNKGISHAYYNPSNYDIIGVTNYDFTNGLPSNEINRIALRGNEVWVATRKGLAVIDLDNRVFNSTRPKTYLTELYINDVKVDSVFPVELEYNRNNLKFKIEVLSFKNTEKLKFKYKLLGWSNVEKESNAEMIEFNNLSYGNYTFLVTGMNNNGIPSETIKYSFFIKKPFWLTWWFISLEVLVILLVMVLILSWRLKYIRKREQEKTLINKELAEYQMMALRAQMNPHFIFNAINSIQEYILKKNHHEAYSYLTKFSHLIRLVLNNANENSISLSRELETLKLYVDLEKLRFENSFTFELDVDEAVDMDNIIIPSMLIQPFVENAIWHGIMPLQNIRKGVIKVHVQKHNSGAYIIIEDNGIGRKKSSEINKTPGHKSLGMQLTKQRLDLLSKQLETDTSQMTVSDLVDEYNVPFGTRIELWIN